MKFDIIVMNPPYEGNKKLDRKILLKAISVTNNVVSLQPAKFLQDPLEDYKNDSLIKNLKQIELYEIVNREDANKSFNIILGTDLAICGVGNKEKDIRNKFIYKGVDFEKIFNKTIKKVLNKEFLSLKDVYLTGDKTAKNFVWIRSIVPNFSSENTKYDVNVNVNVNENTGVNFKTGKEAINFAESLQTEFFMFLVYIIKRSPRIQMWALPYMSDYSSSWTNERFYEVFNISKKEQKLIEKTVKNLVGEKNKIMIENYCE